MNGVTTYDVMGLPPSELGTVHVTVAAESSAVAVTSVGAVGKNSWGYWV